MSWRDEWPDVPGDDDDDPHASRDPDDGEEPAPEDPTPFRVAIKDSACEAAPSVAARREADGEVVTFRSRADARTALVAGTEEATLRLQRVAATDPAEVDAYLVCVREPEPAPADRGPPAEGWSVDVRAQQVGAMTEALFGGYRWNPPPIRAYAARDLGLALEAVDVEVNESPGAVAADLRGDGGGSDGSDSSFEGDESSGDWLPDFEFLARRADGSGPRRERRRYRRYLAEVKHGSASFERSQRDRMERLAERAGPELDVLVVRVDLTEVPQSVDVSIRSV